MRRAAGCLTALKIFSESRVKCTSGVIDRPLPLALLAAETSLGLTLNGLFHLPLTL